MAMTLVSTVTVGSGGASSIEFSGIPATGKDLLCVWSFRHNNSSGDVISFRVNNNSSSIYSKTTLRARTSTAQTFNSGGGVSQFDINHGTTNTSTTASTFSNCSIYITNYTSSLPKSALAEAVMENNATTDNTWGEAIHNATIDTTSAISSIILYSSGVDLLQNSTASLYIIS